MSESASDPQFFDSQVETLEDLGRKGLRMIQRRDGFRFGEDTVLLAYFCAIVTPYLKNGGKALELGAGSGAAALLLSARRPDLYIDGIEVDAAAYDVFSRNIELNRLEDRIRPIAGDIRKFPDSVLVKKAAYDLVFLNPPYRRPERGLMTRTEAGNESLLNARFEMLGGIKDFMKTACEALRPGGTIALVHRAVRLPEVLQAASSAGAEPRVLKMIHPSHESEATAFLLSARKGGKQGGFVVEAPLILRKTGNEMTSEMIKVYSDEE